jgi:archaeal type IV pilus assembly protein PilA
MGLKYLPREDAVSPVIGVILMVAITVILAAVIAAFVFGMAGGVQKTKSVAAMAKQSGNQIIVTWEGGQDNSYVSGYNVTLFDSTIYPGLQGGITTFYPPLVGNSTAWGGATQGNDHVVVTAIFSDGASQVVLDTYV